jgi:hypothetical protein
MSRNRFLIFPPEGCLGGKTYNEAVAGRKRFVNIALKGIASG